MSAKNNSNIKSIALVASVAIISLIFGVMLDGEVVPKPSKPLMTEEASKSDKDKSEAAVTNSSQKSDITAIEQKAKQQSSRLTELDQRVKTTTEKAEELTKQADQLIAKSGLPTPVANKEPAPENKNITKRLADARNRLEALKK
jgi:predicted RNase H-like nuclease (RuvC/YqgF family)